MERARRALIACAALAAACDGGSARQAYPIPGETGERLTVEVLNASGRPGHARTATRLLRRAGIDVVYFGNAPAPAPPESPRALDSTRIVVRRGTEDTGERVRRALGLGKVSVALDSAGLLDVSVLLGSDFTPRREFHP